MAVRGSGLFIRDGNNNGLFSNIFGKSCPIPNDVESLSIKGTAHNPIMYVAAACAAITFISSVSLILLHLTRYRASAEQRQIIRICFTPFVFAILSWAEIYDYNAAPYIDPLGEIYEAFSLCALFLLYIQYTAPRATFGKDMFAAVAEAGGNATGANGPNWPKVSWIMVFQFPFLEIFAVIIAEGTTATATYCVTSLSPKFGHLWYLVLRTVGVVLAVLAIFKFYGRTKPLMKPHRGFWKLVCFKLIVFLRFIQTVSTNPLLSIMRKHQKFKRAAPDLAI